MTTFSPSSRSVFKRLDDSPLACITEAYRQRLTARGYAQGTQHQYVSCLAHFAVWMTAEALSLEGISPVVLTRFVEHHLPTCSCPGRVQRHPPQVRAALQQLIPVLLDAGIEQPLLASDEVQIELDRFDTYLRDQRGLASSTRKQRRAIVGDLLRFSLDSSDGRLTQLSPALLRGFINEHLARWSPASAAVLAGALRSYLRYRAVLGDEVASLLPAIVSPANWKLASLPETISVTDVECVLASFNAELPSWRRGVAVTQCVARLGLRSSEVVSLELEDIDWEAGTIKLRRNKSRRVDVLPMPVEVGGAIVDYLCNERPECDSRRLFVRHVAPVNVALQPSLVGRVIRDAYKRCGLRYTRIHIFRHALASRVLDAGGTLKEVSDILRHRSLDTAQIYAKLDERKLSEVMMPWPGSCT